MFEARASLTGLTGLVSMAVSTLKGIAMVRSNDAQEGDSETQTHSINLDGDDPPPSRRDFVKGAAAVGAVLALDVVGVAGLGRWNTLPPMAGTTGTRNPPLSEGVIFPDPSLCIGCLTCEVICSRVHQEQGLSAVPRIRIFNDDSTVLHPEIEEHYPGRGLFIQQPCLQCPTAECLFVCPVDAFKVEPTTGARIIDEETCVSCGRCANACPYPVFDEAEATNQEVLGQRSRISYDPELDTFTKCDMCFWRPEGPACVERCPVNIRIWEGIIDSDVLCLDAPRADQQTWDELRAFQTFPMSPAPPPETAT